MSHDHDPVSGPSQRALTAGEAAVLHALLKTEFPGRDALAAQMPSAMVTPLLHVVDGLVNELEIYREDSKPLKQVIDPNSVRVVDL